MSLVAGIDLSTKALDLVLVDENGIEQPRAYTYELGAGDIVERIRTIGTTWPARHSSIWDDVLAIGIERPAGRFGVAQVSMAFGAVLAMLPTDRVVKPWQPAQWKIAAGLKGNATKEQIQDHARQFCAAPVWQTPDSYDAYLIARATLSVLERKAAA